MPSQIKCRGCQSILPSSFKFCPKCGKEIPSDTTKKSKRRPRGSGTVFKVKDKRAAPWVVKKDGKLLGYFTDFASAERFLSSQQDKKPDKANVTLKEIHDRWKTCQATKD